MNDEYQSFVLPSILIAFSVVATIYLALEDDWIASCASVVLFAFGYIDAMAAADFNARIDERFRDTE